MHFRLWAPDRKQVAVVFESVDGGDPAGGDAGGRRSLSLDAEGNGYFSGLVSHAAAGHLYWYAVDGNGPYPDPASRFQPDGPHGPSEVIDPGAFSWTDRAWKGVPRDGQVLYEMHIGTFSAEGTFQAAVRELRELADLGVTLLEVMPVADFPGRFGWGYDGVNFFAPTRLYGRPDDFRKFVDAAHAVGLGVILDVVYNHAGPDGNVLPQFAHAYHSQRHTTDWGPAFNFDDEGSGPVRELFLANAAYWIDEFHLDGLRIDATQDVHDDSDTHILAEITARVRHAAPGRSTFIVAENEPQHARLVRPPEQGGYGMDALWNDDFHHSAMVRLSGHSEAYYMDYRGRAQEFVSAAKWGFLYQGQWYSWQKQRRGAPAWDLPPAAFVHFIQNHDQIANTCRGLRCHAFSSPGEYKAMSAVLLLGPQTPMLFQGQEFAASSPFFYFADPRDEELARMVYRGRKKFLSQFRSIAQPEVQAQLPDPADPQTFVRSKLDFADRVRNAELYAAYRDLLAIRRTDEVLSRPWRPVDGAVLNDDA
ncbi:MAG TPA: malto-oligosyltrehalose trehalohydrolase, partial [Planctomycetaceae bacterium]|nr:malto-oligosyltrehalose trehalohydrolase [Planctomycetaceae bacterium]